MNKTAPIKSQQPQDLTAFPAMRKSHCAQQSFAAELNRVRALSIEERVLESLGMSRRFAGLIPDSKER